MDSKILVIDIETTGFSKTKNKIVEIGIVSLDLLNGDIETLFSAFIKEDGITREEITKAWVIENSDITVEDIWKAENLQFYFDEIQRILNEYTLGATAFNNSFDFGFLQVRGFIIPAKLICPMKLATDICRIPGKKGGWKWPNVEEAYRYFYPGEDYIELHRGADDAYHEAKIVYALYKIGMF